MRNPNWNTNRQQFENCVRPGSLVRFKGEKQSLEVDSVDRIARMAILCDPKTGAGPYTDSNGWVSFDALELV